MVYFQEASLLSLTAFLIIWYMLSGVQFVWLGSLVLKGEAIQKSIVVRAMEVDGSTSSNGKKKKSTGKANRKFSGLANSMTSSVQTRRRSGRLANLYWKDLSGISSETDPIILDIDSSEDDVDDGIRNSLKTNEDVLQTNQARMEERSTMKTIIQIGKKEMKQAPRKGMKAGHGGQDAGK